MRTFFVLLITSAFNAIMPLSGNWDDGHGCIGWKFEFKTDKNFHLYVSCMGPQASISGEYEVNGDEISFKRYKTDFATYVDEGQSSASLSIQQVQKHILKGKCRLIKSDNNLKYSEGIECPNIKSIFWHEESAPMPDKAMSYKNIPVVTSGEKYGKTTECVRMREKPNQSAKIIRYILVLDENKTSDCIPKGTKVRIYARTSEKEKIKNYENYWYLVKSGWHDEVWVYGEFIAIEP